MASFDPKPVPGYDPLLRLNLREEPEGGALLAAVQALWKGQQALPQREPIVLVHGFNNHRREAEAAYAGLRGRQHGLIGESGHSAAFDERLGDAFWPGDADWPGVLDWLDFFVYPQAVVTSRDAGPRLAEYLRGRSDILTVHFLAHSLGCRVVLEAIADLQQNGGPRVGKVCLMAAAVPTFKVCPGGALQAAIAHSESLLVLYSPADLVLAAAFPPGQTVAAGDEGFFPEAIGHAGNLPLNPGHGERALIAGAGHGEYWGHRSGSAPEQAALQINRFFGLGTLAPRTLAARPLPARALPLARQVAMAL